VLVQDNLNTHKPASLYEAFPAPKGPPARRALRESRPRYCNLGLSQNWT